MNRRRVIEGVALGASGGRKIVGTVLQIASFIIDHGLDLEQAFHQPRIDVSGGPGAGISVDRRLPAETRAVLDAALNTVAAEPVPSPMPFTIASAVRRTGDMNEGATEPEQPWSEAVAEDEV